MDEVFQVKEEHAVMSAVTYASFLNQWGLQPDNFVLFFRCMEIGNKYVIDALTEGKDLEHFFDGITPTYGLVNQVFKLLEANKKGGIYEKVLVILLGFLNNVYLSPQEGYDLYSPDIEEINKLAKFLDETKKQDFPVNRIMLDILKHLDELDWEEKSGPKYTLAKHAGKIRSNFLDDTRHLNQSIPSILLELDPDFTDGIKPPYVYQD